LGKTNRLEGKIKGIFTRNAYCWLAFFAAAALMTLVYVCFHVIPFGSFTVLRMDLYHQYGPLFAELYDRVTGLKSLLYSWTSGMGGGFLGNFYNYVCSPLTLVTLLLGRERILESISLIILLNAACSAASFTYFLKRARGVHSASSAAFGVLYAFCGWFIAYYWNIMWLDGMTLLPLVVLGVELVVKERKSGWLMFSLAMALFSNYYMGYMSVIFAALYFIIYFFANHKFSDTVTAELPRYQTNTGVIYTKPWDFITQNRLLRTGIRFAATGIAAAGLVAFALLPVWYTLGQASATSGDFPEKSEFYNTIFDFFANHLAGLEPTIRSSGDDVLPNVYSGMAALLLVPLFLFAKKISGREKAAYTVLLAVLFFSMNVNSLNYIWHGFHFPNDLPYRFSYIYSFMLLLIAFRAFQHIKDFSKAQIAGAGVAVVLWIVLLQEIGSKNLTDTSVFISLAFAFIYTLLFGLLRKESNKFRTRGLAALLLCIVCAEVAIAGTDHYEINQKKEWFADDRPAFVDLKERLDEREGTEYYRMELSYLRARMDPCWFGYNGVSTFSSMAYEKTANLEKRLGMFSNYINSYTYFPQTPVYNAMHALRYVVFNNLDTTHPVPNPTYYKAVDEEDKFHAYDNLYSLPVAFGAAKTLEDWLPMDDYNPFSAQEAWFSLATGEADVFTPVPVDSMYFSNVDDIPYDEDSTNFSYAKQTDTMSATATVSYIVPKDQNLYIYARSSEITTMTVRNSTISLTYNPHDEYILDLGACKAGEEISAEFLIAQDGSQSGGFNIRCYGLDDAVFQKGYDKLKKARLNVTKFTDTHIEGTVNMAQDGLLFTSIPYDEGWHITVDGESVKTGSLCAALVSVPLTAGEHTITMRYLPKGLLAGVLLSLITALAAALWFMLEHLAKRRAEKKALLQSIPLYLPAPTPTETLDGLMMGIAEPDNENEPAFPVDETQADFSGFSDAPEYGL
jgi:uncharacterized membrane protein YfhO